MNLFKKMFYEVPSLKMPLLLTKLWLIHTHLRSNTTSSFLFIINKKPSPGVISHCLMHFLMSVPQTESCYQFCSRIIF